MDDSKAAEILKSLAAGVDPADGASVAAGGPLQSLDVLRALHLAAESLEARTRQARLVKHGRLEAEQAANARIR